MIRERGQERKSSRTVGNRTTTGQRPRIRKNESEETTVPVRKKLTRFGASDESPRTTGKRIGKSRPEAPKSDRTPGIIKKKVLREKTSDRFRKEVIAARPARKKFEGADTDSLVSSKGTVIRGRFGKQNLYNELSSEKKSGTSRVKKEDGTIRLNRFIANAGMCSRREADTFIATGCVTVNGKIISEMGYKVELGDQVSFNGQIITTEKKVYLLLNKPKGFVTTVDDPHAEKTVMDLVKSACYERIYPVGRLDKNTTGLLLFTNDGDLTKRLTHPKYNRKKIYHVFLDQRVTKSHLE